ncbi:hypothetical protein ACTVZO_05490 [Streptomyces sp. IBSNAI002]|uniref:hypothetical protein n=1 Tax=Streptomyces sp. IBSNAI002 TaxID=3457500 RepID=UPI003FD27DBA
MAERMAFILDGDDNLSPVFRRIGESAERFHRRINEAVDESGGELRAFTRAAGGGLQELGRSMDSAGRAADALGDEARQAAPAIAQVGDAADRAAHQVQTFTRDSSGRIRDMRGRFLSAAASADLLARQAAGTAPEIRIVGAESRSSAAAVRDLGQGADRARPSIASLGKAAGKTGAEIGGKGGGMGGSMGAVAAIAALSFLPSIGALVPMVAGLGVAAGTMSLGFRGVSGAMEAATKGKKEYAAALKALPPPAREFVETLVETKKKFTDLAPEIQKVMLPGFTQALKDSGPFVKILGTAMTEMSKGFGDAAAGVGRLMKDAGFQKDFTRVLELGNVFVKDLTRGLGGLTRGFIDFGAKSEPTLRSLSGGLSDLLAKGLPGMFQGMERGVEGSSKFLDGLFGMINNLLPALGRLSGEVSRTFGPFLGEQMTLFGNVGSRAMDMLGAAARGLKPVMDDLSFGIRTAWIIGKEMGSAFKDAGKAVVEAFLPAGTSVENVRGPLQRLHTLVQENKLGLMEYARIGANVMLTIAEGFIRHLPALVNAAKFMSIIILGAFDAILGGAKVAFGWIPGVGEKLQLASTEFDKFKTGFLTGLQSAEDKTKAFADSVLPRLSENRLKMNISSWESQLAVAKGQLASVPPEKRAKLLAHIDELERKIAEAKGEIASVRDKTVNISVTTHYKTTGSPYRPSGGREYSTGGLVQGPGTTTSDSIPAMLSNREYVLPASVVDRVGVASLDALRRGESLATAGMSAGGGSLPAARMQGGTVIQNHITVEGAMDPVAVAQQLERMLLKLQRSYGLPAGVLSR